MLKKSLSILFWNKRKEKECGEIDKLFVTGCLSERYKPDLEKEMPNVDQFFGTTDLPKLLQALGADYKHELIRTAIDHNTKALCVFKNC